MNKDNLIEKVSMDCPICSKVHEVQKRIRTTEGLVKGDIVNYEEIYYLCPITDEEENEFVSALLMDQNLLKARDAYRKSHGLLTSYEIQEIRKYYGLNQLEFSNLLGWGDVTVTRYESKTIQDETYDNLMRMVKENPLFALENLEKHKSKFAVDKYERIKSDIIKRVEEQGIQYLKVQEIKSAYIHFKDENEYNGYTLLDLDKLSQVLNYFAHSIKKLYKVKLMKLLWYTDAIHYNRYGKSMSGLVYKHMTYGALPIAYDEIMYLPSIKVEEEIMYEEIKYKILPNKALDLVDLSKEEVDILELVSRKFNDYGAKEIVDYMHKEKAYIKTEPYKLISYEFAKELNEF